MQLIFILITLNKEEFFMGDEDFDDIEETEDDD